MSSPSESIIFRLNEALWVPHFPQTVSHTPLPISASLGIACDIEFV